MNGLEEKQSLALAERPVNGVALDVQIVKETGPMIATKDLPIAKQITSEQLLEEEKFLEKKESEIEKRYHGIGGYLRLFQISRVIATLSLYLYLNQFDIHREQQSKHKKERLKKAQRLTRLAVYGEKLYAVRLWFFQKAMGLLRRYFLGNEADRESNQEKQAVWLREKLIELGPTFIKMGQSMGTRADLLPLPFVVELGTLVDSVPPFPNDVAFARIEHELGRKINEVYSEFELEPVAAASLGQVYRARLHSGEEVAVKVQRPNLEATIKGDIVILKRVANFAERFPQLHENYKNLSNIHVPKIYWNATTSKVLTMDYIHGTKVTDIEEQQRRNISPAKVNRLLIKTYLKQLLED